MMATAIAPIPDSPEDHEPDVIHTPEGDNETLPDQPLQPLPAEDGMQIPRGSAPDPYKYKGE